ncbi:hypothetical protein OG21DRAFT_1488428 [Imleria badia]|nr:hypothetical protein OG21DRAFT_1488428 [Imleria badia]
MHVKLNTLSVELNPAMEQARMARGETEARDSQVWLGEGLILCCTHVFGCVGRSCRPYDYFQTLKDKIKSLKVVEERPSENNNKALTTVVFHTFKHIFLLTSSFPPSYTQAMN